MELKITKQVQEDIRKTGAVESLELEREALSGKCARLQE